MNRYIKMLLAALILFGLSSASCYFGPRYDPQVYEQYLSSEDETIRQYYVAMTRAFETLVICEPATYMKVELL